MNTGFTLIELLVVIVIVSILAAVAVPSFQHSISSMRVKSAAYDLQRTFSEAYSQNFGQVSVMPVGTSGNWNDKTSYANAPAAQRTEFQQTGVSWFVVVQTVTTTVFPLRVSISNAVRVTPNLAIVNKGISIGAMGLSTLPPSSAQINGDVVFTVCDPAYATVDKAYTVTLSRMSRSARIARAATVGCS